MVGWLGTLDVPLFVSQRRLHKRRTFPRALAPWCLDSGGFSELSLYGRWVTTPDDYIADVRRYSNEVGQLVWAAPQDWMCEPFMLTKTGKTAEEHQDLTVANYLELTDKAPDLPFIPVLQGWTLADYERHVEKYGAAGVDLASAQVVGLGSVCRRQFSEEIEGIVTAMHSYGFRLHGFGVKTLGLKRYGPLLDSADSMAWSIDARWTDPLPGHTHKNCANCPEYAAMWRARMLDRIA
jgi:hypothetical protein